MNLPYSISKALTLGVRGKLGGLASSGGGAGRPDGLYAWSVSQVSPGELKQNSIPFVIDMAVAVDILSRKKRRINGE